MVTQEEKRSNGTMAKGAHGTNMGLAWLGEACIPLGMIQQREEVEDGWRGDAEGSSCSSLDFVF